MAQNGTQNIFCPNLHKTFTVEKIGHNVGHFCSFQETLFKVNKGPDWRKIAQPGLPAFSTHQNTGGGKSCSIKSAPIPNRFYFFTAATNWQASAEDIGVHNHRQVET
jgi:hypothetical protein